MESTPSHLPMAQQEHYSQPLLPLAKIAYTFGCSVYLKPDLAHTHTSSILIAPDIQELAHSPNRQGSTHMSNSYAVTHENILARCSPHAPKQTGTIHKEV